MVLSPCLGGPASAAPAPASTPPCSFQWREQCKKCGTEKGEYTAETITETIVGEGEPAEKDAVGGREGEGKRRWRARPRPLPASVGPAQGHSPEGGAAPDGQAGSVPQVGSPFSCGSGHPSCSPKPWGCAQGEPPKGRQSLTTIPRAPDGGRVLLTTPRFRWGWAGTSSVGPPPTRLRQASPKWQPEDAVLIHPQRHPHQRLLPFFQC